MSTTIRPYSIKRFAELLGLNESHPIPNNIEKSMFNWCIRKSKEIGDVASWENRYFRDRYKHKSISIQFNIKEPKSLLKERILNGDVKSVNVTNLRPEELWKSGPYAVMIEELNLTQIRIDHAQGRINDSRRGIFKCARCKSNKTTYYEMQTRSADEPMTAFITCFNCGKRWKS